MTIRQLGLDDIAKPRLRTREEILSAIRQLCEFHIQGVLGGERMPEDANPNLDKSSRENYHYFTLPMALNYQRNSYKLWECALATYNDSETRFVFMPEKAVAVPENELRAALTKYKVAIQPKRHIAIWRTICETLVNNYEADVRKLIAYKDNDIGLILDELQITQKKGFPYLSGQKIANYWLYVMLQYTDAQLKNRNRLSIAPDTHVIQASIMLGVIENHGDPNALRPKVAEAWVEILAGSDLCPIDIHTPLWLWSRKNFIPSV
jgi:hypothetical protein